MGLDMYLILKNKEGQTIDTNLYYWRKANQIRNWLVNHIEEFNYDSNLTEYILTKDTIQNLIDDINKVLSDRSKASEVMPTSEGFFFGSNEYDERYYHELEQTAKDLSEIINEIDFDEFDVVYDEWY